MSRIHIATPNARTMNEVLALAFQSFNCAPLGGPSNDGWSKMSDFLRCPYRYYLRHEKGAIIKQDTLTRGHAGPEVGGLVHALLALHYCRLLPEGYPGWRANAPSPFDFLDRVQELGAELAFVNEARRLYWGYTEHYGAEGPEYGFEPVAVEMGAGIEGIHTCRYDMLAWNQGALWIYEHKTAHAETADVLEGWWLDGEILGEVYGFQLSQLDEQFCGKLAGVVINLLFKTTPPKFRRLEIVFPQNIIDSYARDRHHWGQQREQYRRRGHWPRSLQGCMSRYDMCTFWAHCRDEDASLLQIREAPTK
jgi:hypothetical protein